MSPMMNIILLCLIITGSIVYIWDYVLFPQEIANIMVRKISGGKIRFADLKKPWGCSLCMTTWSTLIVLAVLNWKMIPLCLVFGWSTKYILYIFTIIDKILSTIFRKLEKNLQ